MQMISSQSDVKIFLKELKEVLTNPKFDVAKDLDIILNKKDELPTDPYTTINMLQALEFDRYDVLNQLLSLDISEYEETCIDRKGNNSPLLFVFIKTIKTHDVYIKIKIRDKENCKVLCISFHFTRYP